MAAVKIRNAASSMTKHSITQQRNYLEAETTAAISNHKKQLYKIIKLGKIRKVLLK